MWSISKMIWLETKICNSWIDNTEYFYSDLQNALQVSLIHIENQCQFPSRALHNHWSF